MSDDEFSVLHGTRQRGFARVITDRATFAYLSDVYLLDAYRRRGVARRLMDAVMSHPERRREIFRPGMYRQDLGSRTGT